MNLEIWDIPENEQLWNQLKGNLDISEKINTKTFLSTFDPSSRMKGALSFIWGW